MSKGWLVKALLRVIRFSHRAATTLNVVVPQWIEGKALRIPVLSGVGMQNLFVADHDRALQRAVRTVFAARKGAVLDVGCNIGHFMELCVLEDRRRLYFGFDPSVACCAYLERLIHENRLTHHSVLPVGLSDKVHADSLHSNGQFDVCASLNARAHPEGRYSQRRSAITVPGDMIVDALGLAPVALIKIDVEGLELEVLKGLEHCLNHERPAVLFEVLSLRQLHGERDGDVVDYRLKRAEALAGFFAAQNYLLFRLEPDASISFVDRLNPADLVHSVQMDHLALPREWARDVLAQYGLEDHADIAA